MSDGAHLTTWVNRETKTRFGAVARHQGLSDSALLKRLIDTMLQAGDAVGGSATDDRAGRVSRFSIRFVLMTRFFCVNDLRLGACRQPHMFRC
jgi:hypothetical protein